jgi:WW domain-containing oxidoreductase
MSLVALFKGTGSNGFGYGSTAEEVTEGLDLSGKRMLVTGSNSGIGHETLRVLAARGATVYAAARSQQKAEKACREVGGDAIPIVCELGEPDSVRQCVQEVSEDDEPLDAIICNAGIMALPELEQIHGYEKQFFVNHIGHFILVNGLLDRLADDGRVVMLSSEAHRNAPKSGIEFDNLSGERDYSPWAAYGQSKLANLLVARKLAKKFEADGTDRVANAVHPGVIDTNLGRHMNAMLRAALSVFKPLFLKSIPQGAATQTYVAAHPDAGKVNGEYFSDCNPAETTDNGRDMQLADKLWERTEEIVAEL